MTETWLAHITVYRDNPESLGHINSILKLFNEAKQVNQEETIKAYNSWFSDISQSISRFWSLYNNQQNIKQLCIEDFTEEALRIIGQSIEGLSKPFLKLLLQINRIKRNKPFDLEEIQSKDLGVVIDELLNTTDLKDLLVVEPNSIRLNQWRNIAYHHNSKVIKNEIILSYKKSGQHFEFKISRDELFETLKQILLNFKLVRISETIFCIDNVELIQKERNNSNEDNLNIREEAKLLDFYSSLSSQGFQVVDLKFDNDIAKMKLRDMQEYSDFPTRAMHSSQFLYNLWLFTNSSRLVVDFQLYNGEKFLTSEINSDNFIANCNSNTELSELLKDVEFTFVTTKYTQNKNPFKDLQLSEEIKHHPQKFYSQLGDKISKEEFIKQFLLSIFANYLAFKSEGLNETIINIGSDGAMIRTDNQEKNIVFHVPAKIQNKALQLKLIEILEKLIEQYNSGDLELEIVEQAKNYNKYFFKKHLIKDQLGNNQIDNLD